MELRKTFFSRLILAVIICFGLYDLSGFFVSRQYAKAAAASPAQPSVYLDTSYPLLPTTHKIWNVKTACGTADTNCSTNLQATINAASPGDEVVLQAGASFSGPISLPAKNCSYSNQTQCFVVIKSSNLANLPAAGNRVSPQNAADMPKILAPGSNQPAMYTLASAHHYRIVGIEFAQISSTTTTDTLILSGDGSSVQNTLAMVPHDLVFDRVYVHGTPTGPLKRGLGLNSASTAIIDSYFSDFHVVGVDAQAIAGWNGPGPFKIYNNYLEGAAENFLFGGSDPSIANLVPSDIDFEYNYLYKPRSWRVSDPSYGGIHWAIKNIFELKNAQRALIQNNIFDGTWADGQTGYAILFTVRDSNGTCTWCVIRDVTFQNNIVRHAAAGFQITGHDDSGGLSQLTQRVKISNNLWYDINGPAWGGNGWWNLLEAGTADPGPSDVELSHNTVDQTGNAVYPSPHLNSVFITKPNMVIRDNIMAHNSYGVIGAGSGMGNNTLDVYFPGVVFVKNALIAGPASSYSEYPGNYFPPDWSSVLDRSTYRVISTSIYHNGASDGTDIGANIDNINNGTKNVVTGLAPGSTAIAGDLNGDCVVNSLDWSVMNSKWFTADPASDLNHDGVTNSLDWSIMNQNWFKNC